MTSFKILIPTAITLLLGILIVFVLKRKTNKTQEQYDYKTFFNLGIIFFPIGVVMWLILDNQGFIGMFSLGLIYLIAGLSNRDKWQS